MKKNRNNLIFVFVFILVNMGVSLSQTNEVSSIAQVKVIDSNGLTTGDKTDCVLRDEKIKPKSAESTDHKTLWNWGSLTWRKMPLLWSEEEFKPKPVKLIDYKNPWNRSSLTLRNSFFLSTEAIDLEKPDKSGDDLAAIAQQTNNPVSDLWLYFFQYDLTTFEGSSTDHTRTQSSLKFQPVMPMLLTEEIRLINRPVFQLQSFETPDLTTGKWGRETGLGDTILLQLLAPAKGDPEKVWGVGWSHIFPTATDHTLGGEKWAVGPAATYFHLGEKWVIGGVLQHWWDYAGDDSRANVNLTDFQYVLRYKISPVTQIGTGPNIQYNWDTDELALPIGLGADTTTKWGDTVVRYGFDIEYYVHQDDRFGPEWNIRFFFIPIGKAPAWSSKPLFK